MQSSTEANATAHLLAKSALTIDEDLYWVEDCPDFFISSDYS